MFLVLHSYLKIKRATEFIDIGNYKADLEGFVKRNIGKLIKTWCFDGVKRPNFSMFNIVKETAGMDSFINKIFFKPIESLNLDKEIVLEAVKHDGNLIKRISSNNEFMMDKDIVLAASMHDPLLAAFGQYKLLKDKKFYFTYKNPELIKFTSLLSNSIRTKFMGSTINSRNSNFSFFKIAKFMTEKDGMGSIKSI